MNINVFLEKARCKLKLEYFLVLSVSYNFTQVFDVIIISRIKDSLLLLIDIIHCMLFHIQKQYFRCYETEIL